MKISLDKAKQQKLFYVVTTGVIYHPKLKKCLILQRSKKEVAHPGLWGVVGGKLEWSDLFNNPPTRQNHDIRDWEGLIETQLAREALEESGLVVGDAKYLESVVFLRPDNVPVVLIQYAVKYKKGKVVIAPEFDNFAWVDEKSVKQFDCIQGIDREVKKTIQIFS